VRRDILDALPFRIALPAAGAPPPPVIDAAAFAPARR
jgi:hypothetical protein